MSFEKWKVIRDNAMADCDVTIKTVEFVNGIRGAALSLENEYNDMLLRDLRELCTYADDQNLWPSINANNLATHWLSLKNRQQNPFGTSQAGIGAKCAAIQLIVAKVDKIFNSERSYVDKTQHALSLLNRKLFLLDDFRSRWSDAFENNTEPTLEKLGGLHLFECGIWAFKAKGPKEETDLILHQDIGHTDERSPLVMTEWKKATGQKDAETKIEEAKAQCEIYIDGVIRPLKVVDHRFIVVVSKESLQIEKDFEFNKKKYIVRNVAIERKKPSAEAVKAAKSSKKVTHSEMSSED